MGQDSQSLAKRPLHEPLQQADYDSIHAAMMETARGRWFLAEYFERNRNADTRAVLDAIGRLAAAVADETPQPDFARTQVIAAQLLAMAETIARTKTDIAALAAAAQADAPVQRVLAVLRDLDDQIDVMLDAWGGKPQPEQPARQPPAERPPLALVEPPPPAPEPEAEWQPDYEPLFPEWLLAPVDEPALERDTAPAAEAPAPTGEVIFTATFEQQMRAAFARSMNESAPTGPVIYAPVTAANDPLAAIMAMTEEERIALFS